MKKGGLLRYVLIGVGDAVLAFLIMIFLRPALREGVTTAQQIKEPMTWIISVACAVGAVYGTWRKDNK